MWAVVPCKRLEFAKRRLAPVLSAAERRRLVMAMLSDVLAAVTGAAGVTGVLVAGGDPAIADLARAFGARCLADRGREGLSSALAAASRILSGEGVEGVVVVPGDLPLLTAVEMSRVVATLGGPPAVTLAPARRDLGTNLVASRPAGAIPYLFGRDSFRRHLAAARGRGIEPLVLRAPEFGLDIDRPADLVAFARNPSPTRTFRYLAESGVGGRLSRPAERAGGEGRRRGTVGKRGSDEAMT